MNKVAEQDLYLPVKSLLQSYGYEVKGEILDCDVVARHKDNPKDIIIVELKLRLNLTLILQIIQRLNLSDKLYIAIPHDSSFYKNNRNSVLKLLAMLGIGLILVVTGKNAKALIKREPSPYKPKQNKKRRSRLEKEFSLLEGDPNLGGSSTKSGRMTVYRQQSIRIAQYLDENGPTKASKVKDALQEPKARDIMYNNHYEWFVAEGKGVYRLSDFGSKVYNKQ